MWVNECNISGNYWVLASTPVRREGWRDATAAAVNWGCRQLAGTAPGEATRTERLFGKSPLGRAYDRCGTGHANRLSQHLAKKVSSGCRSTAV